jgi:ribosomal protein L31E
MSDKVEAIQQAKENQEVAKQGQKREEAKEKAEAADAKPAVKAAAPAKTSEKKEEKKKLVLDRVYTVPLMDAYLKSRSHRGRRAMSLLKAFLARHAKTALENVRISTEINSLILARGSRNPPKHVKVHVAKDDAGLALVTLVVDDAVRKANEAKAATRKAKKAAQRAASKAKPKPAATPKAPKAEKPAAPAKAQVKPAPKASPA